jgi:hypothetical protein
VPPRLRSFHHEQAVVETPYMRRFVSAGLLPLAVVALSACCGLKKVHTSNPQLAASDQHDKLIAHIEHDGLTFSISIDDQDDRFLKIMVPEKAGKLTSAPRQSVHVRVQTVDDSRFNPATGIPEKAAGNPIIDGAAIEHPPYWASGGYVDVYYRFALGRRVTVKDILAVTIWIGNQRYVAMPL